MHEIVVLSGKGGTGKTSVSAALATVASHEVVIADCDVDAANMHLLLHPLNHREQVFMSGKLAVVEDEKCIACGKCIEICRFDAISPVQNSVSITAFECEGCGYCARICPTEAITMEDRRSGLLYHAQTRLAQPMVHARLDAGADNSGKLVAKVKEEAGILAQHQQIPFILVDGAPGIGCPVASSLAGASMVLLVTEPTKSAIHDLKRLVSLLRKSRLKMMCLINKYDLDLELTSQLEVYLQEEQIPMAGKLAFSQDIPRAMVTEKTMAEISDGYFLQFENIWEELKNALPATKKTN